MTPRGFDGVRKVCKMFNVSRSKMWILVSRTATSLTEIMLHGPYTTAEQLVNLLLFIFTFSTVVAKSNSHMNYGYQWFNGNAPYSPKAATWRVFVLYNRILRGENAVCFPDPTWCEGCQSCNKITDMTTRATRLVENSISTNLMLPSARNHNVICTKFMCKRFTQERPAWKHFLKGLHR